MENTTISDPRTNVFTRREAAHDMRISLPTLDGYIHRPEYPLPHFYAGRRILIPVADLKQWLSDEVSRQMLHG